MSTRDMAAYASNRGGNVLDLFLSNEMVRQVPDQRSRKHSGQRQLIPGYSQILKYVANYTGSLAIAITVVDAIIGVSILLGVSTRVGAAIGAFLGLNLMLTFAFCRCSLMQEDFPLVFWFCFFPIVLNLELIFDNSSSPFGLPKVLREIRHSRKSE